MAVISTNDPGKKAVFIFFERGNEPAMKNFASRVRNDNKVDAHMIWSHLFSIDDMPKAAAIILQVGAPRVEQIERAYRRVLPDCEVHYVDSEGNWYDPDAQEDESEPKPVVSAPAGATAAAGYAPHPADPAHQSAVGGEAAGDGAGTDAEGFRLPAGYGTAEDTTGEEASGDD